ncbi:hypothetical protein HW561_19830 [Rhodobacteraceae bacterium B1Z28]|uniref:Uncharacterized protein n=1 Tax=Ruegeria haliotis TaxID=2747601 RepID=A0ABX2PV42_9RHOB|nr:hypothetical protein [Ruegeria haliotis]NVO58050.1 hypothetical protein [Ruegeria haliotis]
MIDAQGFADVMCYSHGWNNDFPTAKARYESFFRGLSDMQAAHPVSLPDGFNPLIIGIFWPSTILLWPDERTPDIAASGAAPSPEEVEEVMELLDPETQSLLHSKLTAGDP